MIRIRESLGSDHRHQRCWDPITKHISNPDAASFRGTMIDCSFLVFFFFAVRFFFFCGPDYSWSVRLCAFQRCPTHRVWVIVVLYCILRSSIRLARRCAVAQRSIWLHAGVAHSARVSRGARLRRPVRRLAVHITRRRRQRNNDLGYGSHAYRALTAPQAQTVVSTHAWDAYFSFLVIQEI